MSNFSLSSSRSLKAMLAFGKFDSIWVSTDHDEIEEVAKTVDGVKVIERFFVPTGQIIASFSQVFRRSPRFATSTSSGNDAIKEFLKEHPEVEIVCAVQATAPFIRPRLGYIQFNLT